MAAARDLIILNVTAKNGKNYSGQIAVDPSDLTCPTEDAASPILRIRNRNEFQQAQSDNVNADAWTVSDSLTTIADQDFNLMVIPIIKRESFATRNPQTYSPAKDFLFYLPYIIGAAEDDATGCHFNYAEQGNPNPVKYYTSLTVAQLVSQAPAGGITGSLTPTRIPYASAATVLSDSWLERTTDGVALDNGKVLSSSTANKAQIDFGPGGDQLNYYTDGGAGNEMYITGDSTYIEMGVSGASGQDSFIYQDSTFIEIHHETNVSISSPVVGLLDNSSLDSSQPSGTVSLFNANASLVNAGRGGATWNMASTFAMQDAHIECAASTAAHSSIQIPGGVAPTSPQEGDVWATTNAQNLLMRQNGEDRTFLLSSAVTTEVIVPDTTFTVVVNGLTYKIPAVLVP